MILWLRECAGNYSDVQWFNVHFKADSLLLMKSLSLSSRSKLVFLLPLSTIRVLKRTVSLYFRYSVAFLLTNERLSDVNINFNFV